LAIAWLGIWVADFTATYAFTVLICAGSGGRRHGLALVPILGGVLTLLSVAALGAIVWRALATGRARTGAAPEAEARRFGQGLALTAAALALAAVAWNAIPLLWLPPCR
jgi:hypothetical protein